MRANNNPKEGAGDEHISRRGRIPATLPTIELIWRVRATSRHILFSSVAFGVSLRPATRLVVHVPTLGARRVFDCLNWARSRRSRRQSVWRDHVRSPNGHGPCTIDRGERLHAFTTLTERRDSHVYATVTTQLQVFPFSLPKFTPDRYFLATYDPCNHQLFPSTYRKYAPRR